MADTTPEKPKAPSPSMDPVIKDFGVEIPTNAPPVKDKDAGKAADIIDKKDRPPPIDISGDWRQLSNAMVTDLATIADMAPQIIKNLKKQLAQDTLVTEKTLPVSAETTKFEIEDLGKKSGHIKQQIVEWKSERKIEIAEEPKAGKQPRR